MKNPLEETKPVKISSGSFLPHIIVLVVAVLIAILIWKIHPAYAADFDVPIMPFISIK